MFTPTINGNYSVIISKEGCYAESDCVSFAVVGIESAADLRIYPNPVSDVLYVESADNRKLDSFQIINVNRQIVKEYEREDDGAPINIGDLSAGVYFIRINLRDQAVRILKK